MSDTRANISETVRDTSRAAVQAAKSATDRGAEAAEHSTRAAAETLRQGGQAAAEVSKRAGEAGADTLRRSTDAIAGSQRQITEDAAGRLQEVSRSVAETARGAAEDMRALISLPKVADRGLQDVHRSVTTLVEGVVRANLRATAELMRLTSPAAFFDVQQRFVRDYMNAVMEGSAAIVRAVRQTVDQSLPALEQHLRQRRQSAQSTPAYQPGK
jgi:hypothetical protein